LFPETPSNFSSQYEKGIDLKKLVRAVRNFGGSWFSPPNVDRICERSLAMFVDSWHDHLVTAAGSINNESMNNIERKLQKKSKEWLINQLVELSDADPVVADRLKLKLVAQDEYGPGCIAKFKRQLDKAARAIIDHGPGSWDSQVPTTGFDSVVDALAVLVSKNLNAVMEISEYGLVKLDSVFDLQDECELEYLVDDFRQLHLQACNKLEPDPRALAVRLAELRKQTEWGFFDGPPEGYSKLLGQN
jgi:hypothetical protein